jgi:hypothetical protein
MNLSDLSSTLVYLAWQSVTLAGSAVLASNAIREGHNSPGGIAQFAMALLGIHLLLTSSVGLLLTAVKGNSPAVYLCLALILLALVLMRSRAALATFRSHSPWMPPGGSRSFATLLACGIVVLIPPLVFNVAPVTEIDSLHSASALLRWAQNSASPYILAAGTGHFWEFAYLPGVVLTHSDHYHWLTSLEAVLLCAFAVYVAASLLGLRPALALLAALNAMAIYHFWYGPTGVMTLKVDMIFAAGTLILLVACLRMLLRKYDRATLLWFGLGLAFSIAKNNGPITALAALCVLALALLLQRNRPPKTFLYQCLTVATAVALVPGHYYVRNTVLFGNPFYPIELRLPGISLPGPIQSYAATSIAAHLGEPQLWLALLARQAPVHYAGALFPFTVLGIFLAGAYLIVRAAYLRFRSRPVFAVLPFTAALAIIGWLLYFQSPWSAGAGPHDLAYLLPKASLRYVLPFLFLSEAVLLAVLTRLPFGGIAAYAAVLTSLGTRLYVLYFQLPGVSSLSLPGILAAPTRDIMIASAAIAALIALLLLLWRPPALIAMFAAAGIVLVCVAPVLVEANRELWLPLWRPVVRCLAREEPSTVFHTNRWGSGELYAPAYASAGIHSQHRVTEGSADELLRSLAAGSPGAQFVVVTSSGELDQAELGRLEAGLARFDYAALGSTRWSAIYRRAPRVPLALAPAPNRASFCFDPSCLCAQPAGGPTMVFTASPVALWLRDRDGLRRLTGSEGQFVEVGNLGGQRPDGSMTGLHVSWNGSQWTFENETNESIKKRFGLSSLDITDPARSGWNVVGNVKWETSVMDSPVGRCLRIRVQEGGQKQGWAAVVYTLPPNLPSRTAASLTCRLRASGARANLHYFDFGAHGVLESRSVDIPGSSWSRATITHTFQDSPVGDYVAIAIFDAAPGSYLEIREAAIARAVLPEGVVQQ